MFQLLAVIINELNLLWRDRSGLLVLFLMPSALVLVITLVQENVLKTVGESDIQVLFVDYDRGAVGHSIEEKLREAGNLALVNMDKSHPLDIVTVKARVLSGEFQVAVVVPAGLTSSLQQRANTSIRHLLEKKAAQGAPRKTPALSPSVEILFDPTVMGGLRSAIHGAVDAILMGIEIRAQLDAFSKQLPGYLEKRMEDEVGVASGGLSLFGDLDGQASVFDFTLSDTRLAGVTEVSPTTSRQYTRPTSVQQNVPAWALFGIFFLAVPIAGSLIKERKSGTYRRLLSFPVSPLVLLSGKMVAFMLVGVAQLICIGLIGGVVLPLLGTPVLEMGNSYTGILLMATAGIMAASGYGVLLGTLGGTYEQVSMLGPITIVIAAAIGGIMVPVYAMPSTMQVLSRLSPLAWGLNGFLELFVRGGDATTILPWAVLLLAFCAVCLGISWLFFFRRLTSCGH